MRPGRVARVSRAAAGTNLREDVRVEISIELVFWGLIGLIAAVGGVGVVAGLFGLYRPKG